jgi:hypothetical protein
MQLCRFIVTVGQPVYQVRVGKDPTHTGFAIKAVYELLVACEMVSQQFDCDLAKPIGIVS